MEVDYARIFSITFSAVVAGNAASLALFWAIRAIDRIEKKTGDPTDAPGWYYLTIILVGFFVISGIILTFSE